MTHLLIRVALLAWPAHLRARHGRALVQMLAAAWQAEGRTRVPGRWLRRAGLLTDAAWSGLAERFVPRTRPRGSLGSGVPADMRAAWRTLSRRPTFAVAVIVTLALGLGSTTAIFAVLDAVLLRPLPYPDDLQLVRLGEREASRAITGASFPAIDAWRAFPEVASLAAFETSAVVFANGGSPERVTGAAVTPDFFQVLGVEPAEGRGIVPGRPLFGGDPAIVLGHDLWQRRFGGDANLVGTPLTLENRTYTVVGIMPRGFSFPDGAEFWRTLPASMSRIADSTRLRFMDVVARLRSGSTVADVAGRLDAWAAARPSPADGDDGWRPFARSLREEASGAVRPALMAVSTGVVLLLFVACANVTALLLAHGRSRIRDLAVRAALGASRSRLVRQLLFEGVLLSLGSATLAVLAARTTQRAIIALSAGQIPRIEQLDVDGTAVAFAVGLGLLATLGVGLAPAWSLSRRSHQAVLSRGTRSVHGSGTGRRWFGTLVVVEFGLAVVLVAAAGLLLNSYRHLQAVDTGVVPNRIGVARIVLPLTPAWQPDSARRRLHDDLLARVRALPSVEAAGLASRFPLDRAAGGTDVHRSGRPDRSVRALPVTASPGAFATLRANIVAGRPFTDADVEGAPPVVILNDVAARGLFGDASPIGEAIEYEYFTGDVAATVVGVVRATRYGDLTSAPRPAIYLPTGQATMVPVALIYRTTTDPMSVVSSIRGVLAEVDTTASVVLDDVTTLDHRLAEAVARPRFFLVLSGTFAALALLLAACGIYGTTAFWIGERWREFGVRVALGASPGHVTRLVVARGLVLAGAGIVAGLASTWLAGGLIRHLLFGVAPTDPTTLAGAAAVLAAAGAVACWLPARRVAAIDPAVTLRAE